MRANPRSFEATSEVVNRSRIYSLYVDFSILRVVLIPIPQRYIRSSGLIVRFLEELRTNKDRRVLERKLETAQTWKGVLYWLYVARESTP